MGARVVVVGAGSWGTTVGHLVAHNTSATVVARRAEIAEAINDRHENPAYLAEFALHESLSATTDLAAAVAVADVIVMGVPSASYPATLAAIAPVVARGVPIVSLAKGFDSATNRRMTELIAEALPGHPVGVLTGPNLAKEILAGGPAASVLAFDDELIASSLQPLFNTDRFRVYLSRDVVGCELAGALKNVIALAAGISVGLGVGDNSRATIITRGLAELTRLGVALGGEPETFAGLAGMGDLLATCMSPQSRNRTVGVQLGQGRAMADIAANMDQVAEGVKSAAVVTQLAAEHGVYMPISEQVRACVEDGRSPYDAYAELVRNPASHEHTPG